MKLPITILLVSFIWAGPLAAESRYVTDTFEITLRSGKSTKNEILRMLPSGTRLEVLEVDTAEGYTRVKTDSGTEGWVLSRYLMDLPSARDRLSRAETRLANTEQGANKVRADMDKLQQANKELEKERNALQKQNKELSARLDEITRISSNAVQLATDNKQLKLRISEVDREIQFLQQENVTLQDRSKRDWFLVGALVVVASMIFGIILTRISWRKKSNWGDL